MLFFNYLEDFFKLIYPDICMACEQGLMRNEKCLCSKCLYGLPRTNMQFDENNFISQLFWGKVNIHTATAYYYFEKESKYRKLIHKLKYHGNKEVGYEMGKFYGSELYNSNNFKETDIVIPVPLHPKKKRKRGYNQSDYIAMGIAKSLKTNFDLNNLVRTINTATQTKKSRMQRWKNVESIFKLKYPEKIKNKNILIVDDVVTTGSTLEACAIQLINNGAGKVNLATLAVSIN